MKKDNLASKIQAWPRQWLINRIDLARALLVIHGYLRDSESARIKKRLHQDALDSGMKVAFLDQET
jgi:hypothetical protein